MGINSGLSVSFKLKFDKLKKRFAPKPPSGREVAREARRKEHSTRTLLARFIATAFRSFTHAPSVSLAADSSLSEGALFSSA